MGNICAKSVARGDKHPHKAIPHKLKQVITVDKGNDVGFYRVHIDVFLGGLAIDFKANWGVFIVFIALL